MRGRDRAVGAEPAGRAGTTLRDEITASVGSRREAGWVIDHVERALGLEGAARDRAVRALVARRAGGEPLQYVLGRWPFRSLELDVDPRVLIPRPETEQVVEAALAELAATAARPGRTGEAMVCADLGTGSGAIALSLAAEWPSGRAGLEIWGTDRSPDALEVARHNRDRQAGAGRLGAARVELAFGDWFEALPPSLLGRFDLVVANPPYVAEAEYERLDPTVRDFEPVTALVAGPGGSGTPGMADVEIVLRGSGRWLQPGGAVVVEIAPHQAEVAGQVARSAGFRNVRIESDLAGMARMVVGLC